MKKTIWHLSVYTAAALLALAGCSAVKGSGGGTPSLKVLTIGTADSGGTMYPVGKAIAKAVEGLDQNIRVNISASNGSAANVRSLEAGEIDMGLVSGDAAFDAVNGKGEFSGQPAEKLRAVAAVYPSLSNWMALSSSNLQWVHDLKGKKIGVGPQDSTTELSARTVFDTLGINEDNSDLVNCGLGSGAVEVQNGTLDAIHGFTGIPINGLSELAGSAGCRLLKYTDQELRAILRTNGFYYSDIIPAGTYTGQEEDVPTFGIKCLLCVSGDMDEELAYELASILYQAAPRLKAAHGSMEAMGRGGFMYEELPISLHPGAERFYRDQGLLEQH